jgi:hypothetical protein
VPRTPIAGIGGVLGDLITRAPISEDPPQGAAGAEPGPPPDSATPAMIDAYSNTRPCTRLGRPPGRGALGTAPKDKVTVRIATKLIAEYRDWSWEQRCQLGELVERALASYRDLHRRPPEFPAEKLLDPD